MKSTSIKPVTRLVVVLAVTARLLVLLGSNHIKRTALHLDNLNLMERHPRQAHLDSMATDRQRVHRLDIQANNLSRDMANNLDTQVNKDMDSNMEHTDQVVVDMEVAGLEAYRATSTNLVRSRANLVLERNSGRTT